MSEILDQFLKTRSPAEYSQLGGVEYLFQAAVDSDRLDEILLKFPRKNELGQFIQSNVLSYEPLPEGWVNKLLQEIQLVLRQFVGDELSEPNIALEGPVNYDTDEMFTVRAVLFDIIWDNFDINTVDAERAFLSDFLYGIDFTHWTKWAVILLYTDFDLRLPTVLQARRNGVDFAIDGTTLVYSVPKSEALPADAGSIICRNVIPDTA